MVKDFKATRFLGYHIRSWQSPLCHPFSPLQSPKPIPPKPIPPKMPFSRRAFVAATTAVISEIDAAEPPHAIRVGQIGTKHSHASGKMKAIRGLSGLYEVVGVAESDSAQQQRVRDDEAYRGLTWMKADDLLASDVEVIAVETEVRSLVPTAIQCIRAGKHIHLDKPAGESMSQCRQLHAEATSNDRIIQMGYMLRYNPAFQFMFQVVSDGWLGRITEITAEMGKKMNDRSRQQLSQFEGGGMFELSCHVIDAIVTVLGKPNSITAHNHRSYPNKDTFADNQLAVFDYEHAIATVRCNHLDPFGFPRRHFHIVGENGFIEIGPLEPPQVRLALDRPRGKFKKGIQSVQMPSTTGRYDEEFRDLAQVVRGEKKLEWNSKHDLTVHEAVLRASGML